MLNKLKKVTINLFFVIFAFLLILNAFFSTPKIVSAQVFNSTDVIDDLSIDKNFNIDDYVSYTYDEVLEINNDTDSTNDIELLEIISIAEGINNELFIYVYNPTRNHLNFTALEISMHFENVANFENFTPFLYTLKLLSTNGVFDKYLVEDFEVSNDSYRYYNIFEISRPYIPSIDKGIEGGIVNDKGITVAQKWCAYYLDGHIIYEMEEIDVVEIKPILIDYIYCASGFNFKSLFLKTEACHLHYLVFEPLNYNIDKIIDADISYRMQYLNYTIKNEYLFGIILNTETIINEDFLSEPFYDTLSAYDEATYEGNGLFAKKLKWNKIMPFNEFISSLETQGVTFNETIKSRVKNNHWVFAYCVSEYRYDGSNRPLSSGIYSTTNQTISEFKPYSVDVLRLKFLSEKSTYNLGVISDKVTADNIAGGNFNGTDLSLGIDSLKITNENLEKLMLLLSLVLLVIVISFCMPFLISLFKGLVKVINNSITAVSKIFRKK